MASIIGTPLPRRPVAWGWFCIAAFATLCFAIAALVGAQGWWTAFALLAVTVFIYVEPRLAKPEFETVQVDDHGVLRMHGKSREEVAWGDMTAILVETTSAGPLMEDVFFILAGSGRNGCVVSQEAAVRTQLLEELQRRFPEMDDRKLIEAMGCTDNQTFLLWKRPEPAPPQ